MKLVLWLAGVILVLDQLTKAIALRRLALGVPVPVAEGVFSLTLVMNPGLAFGMLSGAPDGWRWIAGLLSLVALVILSVIAARLLPTGGVWTALSLGLVFGGAAGNLIDRVRFGAVVDFLDFHWRGYHWWTFNLADSGISVGVGVLVLYFLVIHRRGGA